VDQTTSWETLHYSTIQLPTVPFNMHVHMYWCVGQESLEHYMHMRKYQRQKGIVFLHINS